MTEFYWLVVPAVIDSLACCTRMIHFKDGVGSWLTGVLIFRVTGSDNLKKMSKISKVAFEFLPG
jgi:hypothetical protein